MKSNVNKKIMMLVNHDIVIYNFRLELVERLINDGYEVYISSPYGERIDDLIELGCRYYPVNIDRHGINLFYEVKLIRYYRKILRKVHPLVVLSYTIKPNLYGGMAAKAFRIPYIANITGLGTAVENKGIIQKLIIMLYKIAFSRIHCVFFQNSENRQFFVDHGIVPKKHQIIPGSGVNLERFTLLPYPNNNTVEFAFISRIMKEKGIEQYLQAATYIRNKYSYTRFHICGFCEDDYENVLNEYEKEGIIIYHGMVRDIKEILKEIHCTILPSYFEGMSNALLESAASGRPIIATMIAGCQETFDENISGFGVEVRNLKDLIDKIEKFLKLSDNERKEMGIQARRKMEKEFDRQIVVNEYIKQIHYIEEN